MSGHETCDAGLARRRAAGPRRLLDGQADNISRPPRARGRALIRTEPKLTRDDRAVVPDARGPTVLAGEVLNAVAFVMDYVEFHFNGPKLTAVTDPLVTINAR